mgnify:CR=1 FL=1
MTITPRLDEKMEVITFIETKMREGKANPKIRGWAMSTILEQVKEEFGEKEVPFARDYFTRYYERSKKK